MERPTSKIAHKFMTPHVIPMVHVDPDIIQNHLDEEKPMLASTARAIWLANKLMEPPGPDLPDIVA